jgi:hypothetical protein
MSNFVLPEDQGRWWAMEESVTREEWWWIVAWGSDETT